MNNAGEPPISDERLNRLLDSIDDFDLSRRLTNDRASAAKFDSAEMASCIRRRLSTRRKRRRIAASAAVAMLMLAVVSPTSIVDRPIESRSSKEDSVVKVEHQRTLAEIIEERDRLAKLIALNDAAQAIKKAKAACESLERTTRELNSGIDDPLDRLAISFIADADELREKHPDRLDSAKETYRFIARRFEGRPIGRIAAQRLTGLERKDM
jgi:hypothetical protein